LQQQLQTRCKRAVHGEAMTETAIRTDAISRLLDAVTDGTGVPADLFAAHAVLDATVPGFRFAQHGPSADAGQLSGWFAHRGAFTDLERTPLPDGRELVRFVLTWHEDGDEWAAHQSHLVELEGERIRHLEMFCGGRWDSARQKEISDAM
jgi:hypothetical protein